MARISGTGIAGGKLTGTSSDAHAGESGPRVLVDTGSEDLNALQKRFGFAGEAGEYKAAGAVLGLVPGVGPFAQVFLDGAAAGALTDDQLQPLLKFPQVQAFLHRHGHIPDVEGLRAILTLNKSDALDAALDAEERFNDGLGSSVAGLAGGMALNAVLPGSGLILGGAKLLAGGAAGSAAYEAIAGGRNDTNVPAMTGILLEYQGQGGVMDPTLYAMTAALTDLTEDDHKKIEDALGMKLEDAFVDYIETKKQAGQGKSPHSLAGHPTARIMLSDGRDASLPGEDGAPLDMDMLLRLGVGTTAGRDGKGPRCTLGELCAQRGISPVEMTLCSIPLVLAQKRHAPAAPQAMADGGITPPKTPPMARKAPTQDFSTKI